MPHYKIIKADLEKYKDIVLSINKRNLENYHEKSFYWHYFSSPYGKADCWLAIDESSNKIVGATSVFLRKIYIHNKACHAWVAADFSVDKEHRIYGPALGLQKEIVSAITDNKISIIYGIPNEKAKSIFKRVGYIELETYNRYVKILKINYKEGKHLLNIKRFSKIIDFGLKLSSKETWHKKSKHLRTETLDLFDDKYDIFWNKIFNQYQIIGERSSTFLNWRYKQYPHRKYKIFSLIKNKKDVVAYVVYFIEHNMCHIADVLYDKNENIIECLLAEFILLMRTRNIGSIDIRYFGSNSLIEKLNKFNFYIHKEAARHIYIFTDNKLSTEHSLISQENWHFLDGDTDE